MGVLCLHIQEFESVWKTDNKCHLILGVKPEFVITYKKTLDWLYWYMNRIWGYKINASEVWVFVCVCGGGAYYIMLLLSQNV